jgi:hypothetical protein
MLCLKMPECLHKVIANTPQIQVGSTTTGNNGIIRRLKPFFIQSVAFPNKALYMISYYCPTNFTAGRYSYSRWRVGARQSYDNKMPASNSPPFPADPKEFFATE